MKYQEIKTKSYTFSLVSDIDVENCFLCRVKITIFFPKIS